MEKTKQVKVEDLQKILTNIEAALGNILELRNKRQPLEDLKSAISRFNLNFNPSPKQVSMVIGVMSTKYLRQPGWPPVEVGECKSCE